MTETTTIVALFLSVAAVLAIVPSAGAGLVPPPGPTNNSDCPVGYNYEAFSNVCLVNCSDGANGGCAGLVSTACIPVIGDICVPFFFTVDPNSCHFVTVDPSITGVCQAPYVEVACGSHETAERKCMCLTEDGTVLEGYQSFWVCSIIFDLP